MPRPAPTEGDVPGHAVVPVQGIDLGGTLAPLTMLPGDPTTRHRRGRLERATVTPEGPGTVVVEWADRGPVAEVEAHGPGAGWLLRGAPRLLGATDDPTGFEPTAAPLRDLWRRHGGIRVGATGTLWHDLAWFIVQQRVTGIDAATQWRRLVDDLGTPAPGIPDLRVPPQPEVVAALAYHELHRYGIERRRAGHLLAAARLMAAHPDLGDQDPELAQRRLSAVPGIGPWTIACLRAQTWGAPDTVIVGDAGIPSQVSWVLAGERQADDTRMIELLEPHRPHRYRVLRLVMAAGRRPPRRHHRARRIDIRDR